MWTKYPTQPVVRALGPEIIRCSNPVPSYPFSALPQVFFLWDERTYKFDRALLYSVFPGIELDSVTQCPSGRGP